MTKDNDYNFKYYFTNKGVRRELSFGGFLNYLKERHEHAHWDDFADAIQDLENDREYEVLDENGCIVEKYEIVIQFTGLNLEKSDFIDNFTKELAKYLTIELYEIAEQSFNVVLNILEREKGDDKK
jgi:hypothetical protein